MKLYLVRHGTSNPADIDPAKGLSDIGKKEIATLAALVRHLNIKVASIFHSGKARAEQTADIVGVALESANGISPKSGLAPNDPVQDIAAEITSAGEAIMLVGHLPFMAKLSSFLLAGNADKISLDFKAGGMAFLEYQDDRWILRWLINPEINPVGETSHFESYH